MHKYLFFVLIVFFYTAFSMELTITPLIHSNNKKNIALDSDSTKAVLYRALTTGPGAMSQKSVLSVVCTSWNLLCNNDDYIINHIKESKQFNIHFIKHIFDVYYRCFHKPSEDELIEVVNYPLFDVQANYTISNTSHSLLIYAIEEKHYSLFETLLNQSYIIIQPIILETIIFARDVHFAELLKKHSFHFNQYHFAYSRKSYVVHDEKHTYLNYKVTYIQKKYSEKHAERLFLWIIKKSLFYHVKREQFNEEYLKKFMKQKNK